MKNRSYTRHQFNPIILSAVLLFSFFQPVSALQSGGTPPPPSAPEAGDFKLYLPLALTSPNYYIENMEITQGIQNLNSPVQLVSGRSTLVRVYGRTLSNSMVSGFSATLVGYRGSTYLGALGPVTGSIYPSSVSFDTMRADKTKTFNFQLPPTWVSTSGTLSLTVSIGTNTLVPDQYGSELSYSRTYSLISVPPLNLVVVPIEINDWGWIYGPADTGYVKDALLRMYPLATVNVTVHDTYEFSGFMADSGYWSELLDEISVLKDFRSWFHFEHPILWSCSTAGCLWVFLVHWLWCDRYGLGWLPLFYRRL